MTIKPKPRAERIELRVSAREKRDWEQAARRAGLQLSQWIRVKLNESIQPPAAKEK